MGEHVYVRCDNGSIMLHDLPLPSGIADRVSRGSLRLVNEDGSEIAAANPEPAADPDTVPSGTAATVLDWVGDDPERAVRALDVENAADRPRTTLVAALEALATNPDA
jgi:hypothetical protein